MHEEILDRLRSIEKDLAVIKVRVREIEKRQNDFQSGVNRGLWLIGGGFIAGFVSFIIRGGLSGGG